MRFRPLHHSLRERSPSPSKLAEEPERFSFNPPRACLGEGDRQPQAGGGGAARSFALLAALALSACGGHYRPVSDVPVRIGPPYKVRGVTYTPAAQPSYDMLGYASWYGSESGNRVANGEKFRPGWITGAHTTLPLPSYVEVTSLDTGRRILVRVNDRGPFVARGRILDLSRGAAELLGMRAKGQAAVRVRVADPSERDRAALRKGKPASVLDPVPPRVLEALRERFVRGVGAL
ncbi:rare lipoprotein A [Novosphingobium chloroacetimidivorans]|uniref:Endolytic peptidoglycan transglycosylase RlpA n=1 Tax=Novosphingobium chloroacetimidivorans TaxID=1428314 RepID=A0A7W7KBE7_9SPHN|nr:septal ring lytic transglycosylase RlpA family protein [Novosphingobium chloroacetimidivorans]MBB4859724.1 rare lipoprotein A [Novosphingobium chloroacetimidivorans]